MELAMNASFAMIQCQNCGKSNAAESQFCRFCGNRFAAQQQQPQQDFESHTRRPYSWQTDEFQTQTEARTRTTVGNVEIPHQQHFPLQQKHGAMQVSYQGPQDLAGNYRCPHCGTNFLPILDRRISTAGWITFALLLVFTFVFFWIGLLIKEDVPICPICRQRVY
jgi:predicted RNA-binding Zn-ribbon protein involved in translation (DUF1610 family)